LQFAGENITVNYVLKLSDIYFRRFS